MTAVIQELEEWLQEPEGEHLEFKAAGHCVRHRIRGVPDGKDQKQCDDLTGLTSTQLGLNLPDLLQKHRYVLSRRFPQFVNVHGIVAVNEAVAHARNVPPRNFRMFATRRQREPLHRLANYGNLITTCREQLMVAIKIRLVRTAHILDDPGASRDNIAERYCIGLAIRRHRRAQRRPGSRFAVMRCRSTRRRVG